VLGVAVDGPRVGVPRPARDPARGRRDGRRGTAIRRRRSSGHRVLGRSADGWAQHRRHRGGVGDGRDRGRRGTDPRSLSGDDQPRHADRRARGRCRSAARAHRRGGPHAGAA